MIKYALAIDGVQTLTANQVGALRMAIAAFCLIPITWRYRSWFRTHWKPLLVVGLFGNGIPAFLFAIAQTRIDSALSGMLNTATPLFALFLGITFFARKAVRIQVMGVLIGLIGTITLIWTNGSPEVPAEPLYAGMAVIGSMCYGFSVNVIKSKLHEIPSLAIAGMALIFAGIPCAAYLGLTDLGYRLEHIEGAWFSLGCVVLLAVLGTAFALVIFNKLVENTDAVFASSVTYLLPVVAILWGVIDGETVSLLQFACIAIILAGVVLVSRFSR